MKEIRVPVRLLPKKVRIPCPEFFFFFLRLSDTQVLKPEPTESAIASAFHNH